MNWGKRTRPAFDPPLRVRAAQLAQQAERVAAGLDPLTGKPINLELLTPTERRRLAAALVRRSNDVQAS